ncbi:MAG: hypothetical protein AAFZ52_07015 [Bacteroidota bacterium]
MRFFVRVFSGLFLYLGGTGSLWAQDTVTIVAEEEVVEDFLTNYVYYDLGCNANDWDGYFAPKHWQKAETTGETGGKPPLLSDFVQREEDVSVVVFDTEREEIETWSIEIPVGGYLAFQLSTTGQVLKGEQITVSINGDTPIGNVRAGGVYYSPFLRAGDRFSLNIPAGKTTYRWSQLRFHSNFTAVIVWPDGTGADERYEPIRQGRIQRVLFPEEGYGTWPVFDLDGDPLTDYDRQVLRHTTERFEVDYTDRVVEEDGIFYLQRTFTIRERCRRGNWLRRSRKWAILPIIPD